MDHCFSSKTNNSIFYLGLPPYHCQFTIEMVWSECKRKYDHTIIKTKYSPEKIVTTWNDVLQEIDSEKWESYVSDFENLINIRVYKNCGRHHASDLQPLIVNLSIEKVVIAIQIDDDCRNSPITQEELRAGRLPHTNATPLFLFPRRTVGRTADLAGQNLKF
jgi:hypothetical protein